MPSSTAISCSAAGVGSSCSAARPPRNQLPNWSHRRARRTKAPSTSAECHCPGSRIRAASGDPAALNALRGSGPSDLLVSVSRGLLRVDDRALPSVIMRGPSRRASNNSRRRSLLALRRPHGRELRQRRVQMIPGLPAQGEHHHFRLEAGGIIEGADIDADQIGLRYGFVVQR